MKTREILLLVFLIGLVIAFWYIAVALAAVWVGFYAFRRWRVAENAAAARYVPSRGRH
jgi:hypothetical protein